MRYRRKESSAFLLDACSFISTALTKKIASVLEVKVQIFSSQSFWNLINNLPLMRATREKSVYYA